MVSDARENAKKETMTEVRQECLAHMEAEMKRMKDNIIEKLVENGHSHESITNLGIEEITLKRACSGSLVAESPKRRKTHGHNGTKMLQDRAGFQRWPATKKLEFMVARCDDNPSDYKDSDRQWLLRSKPITTCFKRCCGKDVEQFLGKHGNRDGANFSITEIRKNRMAGCDSCKLK